MSILFVPIYIKYLGIEAWGIVGIFMTLQAFMVVFDMGLSSSITRELSILSTLSKKEQNMRDLVVTMEVIYWVMALIIFFSLFSLSGFIANSWVRNKYISNEQLDLSLKYMGLAIAIQWPSSLYSGGLIGIQKQVLLNKINIFFSTLRGGGAVLVLFFFDPSISNFFLWQIFVNIINIIFLYFSLWKRLPSGIKRKQFSKKIFAEIWHFAAGMSGISILGLILTQIDKVILSKVLSLESFGYYSFASLIAMSLTRLFSPIFYSIYPRLTQIVAENNLISIKKFYNDSSQFMALIILPITMLVSFFSYEIIFLWTGNIVTTNNTHVLLSILICGTAINGLMNVPYALQLAYGWTKLNLLTNLAAIIFMIPLVYFSATYYGVIGVSKCWLFYNCYYAITTLYFMHKRLLIGEEIKWLLKNILLPIISGIPIMVLARIFLGGEAIHQVSFLICLLFIFVITVFAISLSLKTIREYFLTLIKMS